EVGSARRRLVGRDAGGDADAQRSLRVCAARGGVLYHSSRNCVGGWTGGGYGRNLGQGRRPDARSAEKHVADKTKNPCGGGVGGCPRGGRPGNRPAALPEPATGGNARRDRSARR